MKPPFFGTSLTVVARVYSLSAVELVCRTWKAIGRVWSSKPSGALVSTRQYQPGLVTASLFSQSLLRRPSMVTSPLASVV